MPLCKFVSHGNCSRFSWKASDAIRERSSVSFRLGTR
jgi:hypothetical protein